MDRDEIERRDFPTGRRGYDPAAVDEHLRRVADEFETRSHTPPPSLSSGTADQVRSILEAAEHGAAQLRAQAGEDATAHVARVQEAAEGMLGKLDQLESELTRLLTALRTSGERLMEGLAELQATAASPPVATDLPIAPRDDAAPPAHGSSPGDLAGAELSAGDEAGARLAALNMALSGASRDDTRAYLAEHFSLPDLEALLDDVYARAGR